jgi:hypothetical protein
MHMVTGLFAASTGYPLLDVFWTMFWVFLWILWIFLLVRVISDVFRSADLSGWGKAGWTIFLIIFPLFATLIYLVVRGGSMHEREVRRVDATDDAMRSYLRSVTGTSSSTADELNKLADLRDRGVISEEEFAAEKAKLLA